MTGFKVSVVITLSSRFICNPTSRRQNMADTNELPDPPPPLINPAFAANKTDIAKQAASKLREMTAGFTSSFSTISMSSISSNDSEVTKSESQSAIDRYILFFYQNKDYNIIELLRALDDTSLNDFIYWV